MCQVRILTSCESISIDMFKFIGKKVCLVSQVIGIKIQKFEAEEVNRFRLFFPQKLSFYKENYIHWKFWSYVEWDDFALLRIQTTLYTPFEIYHAHWQSVGRTSLDQL